MYTYSICLHNYTYLFSTKIIIWKWGYYFLPLKKKLKVGVQWYVGKYTPTYKEIHNLWDMLKCLKISDMDVGLRFSEVYIYTYSVQLLWKSIALKKVHIRSLYTLIHDLKTMYRISKWVDMHLDKYMYFCCLYIKSLRVIFFLNC